MAASNGPRGSSGTNPNYVAGRVTRVASSFTRPADTTAYASGDIVANSTTAGSVAPMVFDVGTSQGVVRAAGFKTSNTALASGSTFRLHMWSQAPTVAGGDNAAVFAVGAGLATSAGYLGYIDVSVDTYFSDASFGRAAAMADIHFDLGGSTLLYGLFEARGAISPGSASTITGAIEVLPA